MMVRGFVREAAGRLAVTMIVFSVAAVLQSGPARAAAPPTAPDEDLNSKGVSARLAGDNRTALHWFQKAYDQTHSPRATAQLGLVQQALGRWDLAEPLVTRAVQSRSDPWIKKYEAELAKALETIRQHVAHVELVSDPSQTDVFVNGSLVGRLPLSEPVPVVVGQVDIELRAAGYRNAVRNLMMKPFQYERLFVRLEKEGATATVVPKVEEPVKSPSAAATTPASARPDGEAKASDGAAGVAARDVVKWTFLGLAGAGLGTGIVASAIFASNSSQFREHQPACYDYDGTAVYAADKPAPECQDWLSTYKTARTWQIIGFTAAGVFAATWLILQLTEPSDASTSSTHAAREGARRARRPWACSPSLALGADPGMTCSLVF